MEKIDNATYCGWVTVNDPCIPDAETKQAEELMQAHAEELKNILAMILHEGGWGSVTLTLKHGGIDEIGVHITHKPKK